MFASALQLAHAIAETGTSSSSSQGGPPVRVGWHIDNRYYSAQVSLQVHGAGQDLASLDGVPALVVLVDGDASKEEHERILAQLGEERGYQTQVGLIVVLPSLESEDLEDGSNMDKLEDIYIPHGWEVVSLEDDGLERIREALMTHLWPGLARKDDNGNHARTQEQSLPTVTDQDHELAAAFLAQDDDLESFLEQHDPSWPASSALRLQTETGTEAFDDDFDPELTDHAAQLRQVLFDNDLQNQLRTIQTQAERVRAIQDPEERRRQAAIVALAFSMQLDGEGAYDF